jgi:two-component system C4-dicarboxylate transport sensor histidine kinase DctB
VGALVEGALSLMANRLEAEHITVRWAREDDGPPESVLVWGDDVRLQQVLINLLRNALDAMRKTESRLVTLDWEAEEKYVRLSVRDNGSGIPADVLSHVFEPFFTTKPAGEGMGLGLSISEGIVRELGGQLSAANASGGGACFTLLLRRAI